MLKEQTFIKIENLEFANLIVPFTKSDITLTIPENEFPAFLERVYPQLKAYAPVPLPRSLNVSLLDQATQKKLVLRESERHLDVSLKFNYGPFQVDYQDPQESYFKKDGATVVQIIRDKSFEDKAWQRLIETGLKEDARGSLRVIDSKALKWLFSNLPELSAEDFEVIGRESLERYKVRTGEPNIRVGVSSKIDWFDLNLEIDIDGVPLSLKELKKAIKQKSRYVKLTDKSIAQLSEEWFSKFQHLFNFADTDETKLKVSA